MWNRSEMASRLGQAGVERARGFSLNVANFFTTEEEIGYGEGYEKYSAEDYLPKKLKGKKYLKPKK